MLHILSGELRRQDYHSTESVQNKIKQLQLAGMETCLANLYTSFMTDRIACLVATSSYCRTKCFVQTLYSVHHYGNGVIR